MSLFNEFGYLNCTLMCNMGLSKVKKDTSWERNIVTGLRNGGNDFIYDRCFIKRIVDVLRPNEILLVCKTKDYYILNLTTYQQQMTYYVRWCRNHGLKEKNAVNLKRFIEEVKVIWD